MITNEELKLLDEYFQDKEIPENLENLVKKLNLIKQIQICEEKLQKLVSENK